MVLLLGQGGAVVVVGVVLVLAMDKQQDMGLVLVMDKQHKNKQDMGLVLVLGTQDMGLVAVLPLPDKGSGRKQDMGLVRVAAERSGLDCHTNSHHSQEVLRQVPDKIVLLEPRTCMDYHSR